MRGDRFQFSGGNLQDGKTTVQICQKCLAKVFIERLLNDTMFGPAEIRDPPGRNGELWVQSMECLETHAVAPFKFLAYLASQSWESSLVPRSSKVQLTRETCVDRSDPAFFGWCSMIYLRSINSKIWGYINLQVTPPHPSTQCCEPSDGSVLDRVQRNLWTWMVRYGCSEFGGVGRNEWIPWTASSDNFAEPKYPGHIESWHFILNADERMF